MTHLTAARMHAVTSLVMTLACLCVGQHAIAALEAQPAATSGRSILVIPFDTASRDPRGYWLREGSAVALADELTRLGIPAMSREERLRAFDSLRVPAGDSLSHATVIRVGQVVGATQIVVGSYDIRGDELTVRARSIVPDSGRIMPEIVETGRLADLFDVYARAARRLAPGARTVTAAGALPGRPPIAAFEQYIKGLLAQAPATRISFLREALRMDPSFERARIAAWGVHTELGDSELALAGVRQVPTTHPLAREARFLASVSLLQLARYQEAFETLTELNRSLRDASLLNNLGVVQLRRPAGSPGGRASSYFNEAATLSRGDPDVFFNLGYAYWLDRDLTNAIQALREAVRRNPADDAAHYVLGVALQVSGNVGEAARERDLARQLSSTYAEWEATRPPPNSVPKGLERMRMDLAAPATRRVESEIVAAGQRNQQELAAFHLDAGRRAFQAERDDEAIAALRRAVYLSPYDAEAHLLLGRAFLRGGRLPEAIDELKISVWSQNTPTARLVLAEAYVRNHNVAGARSELQSVLARDPSNLEARRFLDRLPPD